MFYRLLADCVLVVHLAFAGFAAFGALLAVRFRRAPWLHLPALLWGIAIEWTNGICPLTPLENRLRRLAGEAGYEEGFIEHWVIGVLYPKLLTLELRYGLGLFLLLVNILIYAFVFAHRRRRARARRY